MAAPYALGFRGEDIGERAEPEVGQVGHTPYRHDLGVARAWGCVGPLWPISASPSSNLRLLGKYDFP